ncbi:hypothetical protein [Pseudoduganella namucuonensis]|uniref:Porin n=1 Tax=Pseudoduganella namucuonensis TaxID=1035707 RepID=A0A1I7FKE5_9BURK|nr:hypothetical protein [Pseudoduganella namucuonensis]SFU36625.1 hypothetical protein SAMN05216552_1002103 [Pseudoduganella namucuonensis]
MKENMTAMCPDRRRAASDYAGALLLSALAMSAPAAAEAEAREPPAAQEDALHLAGSYRSLALAGRASDAARQDYTRIVNRLRLKVTDRLSPQWLVQVDHDTEFTAGSYLKTGRFRAIANGSPRPYLGGASTWLNREDLRGTQHFFRAYAQYTDDATTLVLGRQRVPLGTGRFWSTLDMLNPVNPLQVERDEFVGVDAVFVERSLGALSALTAIYAPDPARQNNRWVARYRTHLDGTDLTLTYGRYWRDDVVGIDFATQYGGVAVRGEAAYTRNGGAGGNYRKLLLGADYVFPTTFSLSSELYFSGQPLAERLRQWQENPQLASAQPYGSAYLGLAAGYDFTPLLKGALYLLGNLKDGSRMLYPSLTCEVTDNSVLMGGAQLFHGKAESEYGRGGNLFFMRFQQFF